MGEHLKSRTRVVGNIAGIQLDVSGHNGIAKKKQNESKTTQKRVRKSGLNCLVGLNALTLCKVVAIFVFNYARTGTECRRSNS